MDYRSRPWQLFFSTVMLLLFFSSKTHLAIAADTISPGQSLAGNQTIVSKTGIFELGFFSPGKSHNSYVGIWYKKIPDKAVVWVANRDTPMINTSDTQLRISEDGNLVLLTQSKIKIWTSNLTSPTINSTVTVLLDTGNLVLRDGFNSSHVLWQSFDHPTDSWLPFQRLGWNKITRKIQALVSWRNLDDPAPGIFSHTTDPDGTDRYILTRNGSEYWTSGLWNGESYTSLPQWTTNSHLKFSHVRDDEGTFISYTMKNDQVIARIVMDLTGQFKMMRWLETTQDWASVSSVPSDRCVIRFLCGAFSSCNLNTVPLCRCLEGFEPRFAEAWNLSDWSGGCVRKISLRCGNSSSAVGKNDAFMAMSSLQLPMDSRILESGSAEECESACLGDCNCTAYSYRDRCLVWNGDLFNLKQLSDGEADQAQSGVLHLRLAASELPRSKHRNGTTAVVIAAVAVGSVVCLGIALAVSLKYYRGNFVGTPNGDQSSLLVFSYKDLVRATNNFSEKLGGGGFGAVYKGTLPDSSVVAVKKLEGLGQGDKQFRAEVGTIGLIRHVNLVRLVGLCSEGTKRLLVYEYMPNSSLEFHLFRENTKILDWKTRHQIALGIARGLSYLHEKCRDCIIHCDVKPENILLDSAFSPKVADFGMAKLIGRDFSRALTSMKGTIGYLAPEWISGLAITTKADVYSFGMMLFEIISGRRNAELSEDGGIRFFPIRAAGELRGGEIHSLLDSKLEGECDVEELSRACRVACWCIQDDEIRRPSMDQVVHILEGVLEVNVPPIPSSLQHLAGNLALETSTTVDR